MDSPRKTIQSLTTSLDEKRSELSAMYHQFGDKLFTDISDPAVLDGAVSEERCNSWRSLMSSRETDTKTILDIKDALNRKRELTQFRKELSANNQEENTDYRARVTELGRTFCDQYSEKDLTGFSDLNEKISVEDKALQELKQKQNAIRQEQAQNGFFKKIVSQVKQTGLPSQIRQREVRITQLFADCGELILKDEKLVRRIENGELNDELTKAYHSVHTLTLRFEDIKKRIETIDTDLEIVKGILTDCEAVENSQRRLDELRARIRDTDKHIDSLTILTAREYSNKFLDEDGNSLLESTGQKTDFSKLGQYAAQLEKISGLRAEISTIRRNIEILETSLKIETIERNIQAYTRTLEDYEHKILHYQELNETLKKNISDANDERQRLVERKEEIEKNKSKTSVENAS